MSARVNSTTVVNQNQQSENKIAAAIKITII